MTPIHFGFILPQLPPDPGLRASFTADLERALDLVDGHFESIRCIDHLGAGHLESFTALAYLAARRPGLQFGHTVACQSFRNPALVAQMGATVNE